MGFYWVVYQKGSFPMKEPFSCPAAAEQRVNLLMAQHWFANLVPPDPPPDLRQMLERCVEVRPPAPGTSSP